MSDEQRESFWKKEISFGRKPNDDVGEPSQDLTDELQQIKAAAVASVLTPHPQRTEPALEPAQPLPPEPEQSDEPKLPFYKKELSFTRKAKAPKAEQERDLDAKPFWKRELAFGKKDKDVVDEQPTELKQRFKVKLPRLERPARAKRGSSVPKRLVGLKVGASQIAAARVENNGSAELVQFARQEIEPGIVVGGELREPDVLAEILRAFFKTHKLPQRNVRLGIANNRIGVRALEIVGIDDPKQLENAIRFRAQEALPIQIEEGEARTARRCLPRARRPLRHRVSQGRHRARRHRPGSVRAAACNGCASGRAAAGRRRPGRRRRRPRPLHLRRLGRSRLRVHTCPRLGRQCAQRCASARVGPRAV